MSRPTSVLLLLALVACLASSAAQAAPAALSMRFSWSADALQDTLVVSGSGWTSAYLWVTADGANEGLFGLWGTLRQTGAIQAHRFRSLLPTEGGERNLIPSADEQRFSFLGLDCSTLVEARAVFEFDVFIDAGQLESVLRPTGLTVFGTDNAELDPLVFFRVNSGDPCGAYSEGFDAVTHGIIAVAGPSPVAATTFGTVKALYR